MILRIFAILAFIALVLVAPAFIVRLSGGEFESAIAGSVATLIVILLLSLSQDHEL